MDYWKCALCAWWRSQPCLTSGETVDSVSLRLSHLFSYCCGVSALKGKETSEFIIQAPKVLKAQFRTAYLGAPAAHVTKSPGKSRGWGGVMEPKELCLSFCRFRSVSKLGFVVFPLKYIMNLSFRGLVPPCTCGRSAFGCIAPTCAFPWSVVPGKLFPAFLCFFRNDDRKGKVCKWSNIIWKKVSAKSNLSEKTARCFFFSSFSKNSQNTGNTYL